MKIIVGLGNPGSQYEKTRHNAGFMVVDMLIRRHAVGVMPKGRFSSVSVECCIKGEKCLLMKPTTFMNLSGRAVGEAVGFFKVDTSKDLLVIVDDVSLASGTIRVRASGSAGGHNGLTDVQRALGGEAYPRLRIGIDACPPMMPLENYVLGRFTQDQLTLLEPAIKAGADAAELFVQSGVSAAMNAFNVKAAGTAPPRPESTGESRPASDASARSRSPDQSE